MQVENLKQTLQTILEDSETILELYLITPSKDIKFSSISDEASSNLLELFKQNINDNLLDDENEYRLKPINEANDEDAKCYYYFDSNNIYEKIEHFTSFNSDDVENFSFENMNFGDIDTFLIKIGTDDNHIILYKKNYPINLLKRGKTIFLTKSDENIDELKDDILKINGNFQFLVSDEHIFVLDLKMLETQLGYKDVIIKNAAEALVTIGAIDFLDDISKIEEMATSRRIAKKINLVKNSPVIDIIKNNQSKVVTFITTHPELKKSLSFNADGKLELKSKVSVEKFLKLLHDDYLKSELTELLYDSLNKDTLKT